MIIVDFLNNSQDLLENFMTIINIYLFIERKTIRKNIIFNLRNLKYYTTIELTGKKL